MSKKESNILSGRIIRSYLSSVISISLVLFLVGIMGVIAVNAGSVSNYFKENININAILKIEVSDYDAQTILKELGKKKYVKSVELISKEQGVKEMKQILGEDFLDVFETNPIPISLELKIDAGYMHKDSLTMIKEAISAYPEVEEVVYQESLVDLLNANMERIGLVFSIFIALLLFISFILINNTVRLNIYSKKLTIHTMRLVGATKGFIARPFISRAFFQGLISGLVAVLALLGVLYLIRNEFYQLFLLFDIKLMGLLLLGVIVLGVLICIICTMFVVWRMISLTKDDLYL